MGPCDGIASRQTILSLVGALQAAEGVTTKLITDLNSVNFGNATTNAFPGTLQNGQNTAKYKPFNKIAQYGLYFNGYNPGRFDGVFDAVTESKVSEFQAFYGLTGIGLVTKEHAKEILGVIVAIGVVVVFSGGLFLVIQFLLGGGALLIQQVAQQV